jgi:hypothetical protein
MPLAIAKIDSARAAGQDVQADMYLYPAGGNSFAACIPPKYAAGGRLLENLGNPRCAPRSSPSCTPGTRATRTCARSPAPKT